MRQQLLDQFQRTYGRAPAVLARAPGRIEFIGNHTDYNGGLVLGAAIDRGVGVALSPRTDGRRNFSSGTMGQVVSLPAGAPVKQPPSSAAAWVNYPLGVLAALPAFELRAPEGFDLAVMSDLPPGAGLSSSAALELASALAFLAATGQQARRETLVLIGQHAENRFVGVPCGVLDQGVAAFGRENHLVLIDCMAPSFIPVKLPADAHFWIFNTHTKHALVDGLYAERHRECLEVAEALRVTRLAQVSPAQVAAVQATLTPTAYRRARHVTEEIARVSQTLLALPHGDLAAIGALLTASHRSSQYLFENSTPALDFLVDVLTATPEVGGARLTGGGFGGAVLALTTPQFDSAAAAKVAAAYKGKFGVAPDVLHLRTSDGAEIC